MTIQHSVSRWCYWIYRRIPIRDLVHSLCRDGANTPMKRNDSELRNPAFISLFRHITSSVRVSIHDKVGKIHCYTKTDCWPNFFSSNCLAYNYYTYIPSFPHGTASYSCAHSLVPRPSLNVREGLVTIAFAAFFRPLKWLTDHSLLCQVLCTCPYSMDMQLNCYFTLT